VQYRHVPPTLGAHTDEVLDAWLAMSGAEVQTLRRNGVI
jgi:crotonobetainyl-CoA:carnitine CoA-transferase CaiB-like acyl-CoA transferase